MNAAVGLQHLMPACYDGLEAKRSCRDPQVDHYYRHSPLKARLRNPSADAAKRQDPKSRTIVLEQPLHASALKTLSERMQKCMDKTLIMPT